MSPDPKLEIVDVGRMGYAEALELQRATVEKRRAESIPDTLILVEHPPVITMGRKATDEDILVSNSTLAAAGVEIHRITRGGEATYHGPGQIVGYAIINLYQHQRKLRLFIERMEEVFISLLKRSYSIDAHRDSQHRGVWVGDEKIVAIGIAVSCGITMHGFAFNVEPDLSHFSWIVPCGIKDRGVTSLSQLLKSEVNLNKIKDEVVESFCEVYGYRGIRTGSKSSVS
jgi:lipoyl(octanoyl) transferase